MCARGAGSLVREGLCGQKAFLIGLLTEEGDCLQQHLGTDLTLQTCWEGAGGGSPGALPVLGTFGPFLPTRFLADHLLQGPENACH